MAQEPKEEGTTNIREMAAQIEADLAENGDMVDEIISDKYLSDGEKINAILEETKDPDMDPVIAVFKLKKCLRRDMDLISLGDIGGNEDFEVIPRIHELLEKILTAKEFYPIDLKYQVLKAFLVRDSRDPAIALFDFYFDKVLKGAFSMESLRENIAKNFLAEFKYRISGLPTKKASIEYELYNKGIQKRATIYNENDPGNPTIIESVLWSWQDFKILQVLKDINETETVYRFNYKFNNDFYLDKSLVEMREHMYETACKSTGKDKQIFGPLVQAYVESGDVPIQQYAAFCGFTKDGWRMPDSYYIKFTPVQAKIRACIYSMCKMKVTTAEAKDMMRMLYNAVSLRHRDILFAHMAIMPFLLSLRDTTDLLYWVALGSALGNTGKTPAGVMITQKIWYNMNRPFITKD